MQEVVVVRGRGTVEVEPDAARLVAEARARGAESGAAHDRAAAIAAAVDAVLERHGGALRRRSTTGLLVTPVHEWRDNGRHFVGWDGVRSSTVEVVDVAAIGDLFAGLAEAGAIAGGLDWIVDPDNPGHAVARREAAVDARARATAYADALGVRLGPVVAIREPGAGDHPVGQLEQRRYALASAAPGEGMAVEAPQLRIDAEVDVTFALLPS